MSLREFQGMTGTIKKMSEDDGIGKPRGSFLSWVYSVEEVTFELRPEK